MEIKLKNSNEDFIISRPGLSQSVKLIDHIYSAISNGYLYKGIAIPSTNPGTVDNRIFYLATASGTYTNLGGAVLNGEFLHILSYDTTWHNIPLDVPTIDMIAARVGSGVNSIQGREESCTASAQGSIAIGYTDGGDGSITASGKGAHAEGSSVANILASGEGAHAEGYSDDEITASGKGAHAEGSTYDGPITAIGEGSHAEGTNNQANGIASHVEGDSCNTAPAALFSHAEGQGCQTIGVGSHAEGLCTVTENEAEHAQGKYNASHKKTTGSADEQAAGSTLFSIGCGTRGNDRKNAVEVMQNGDVYIKGVGGYDGTDLNIANSIQKIAGCDYEENYNTFSTTTIPTFRWLMYRGYGRCGAMLTANQITEILTEISSQLSALHINHQPSSVVVLDSFGLIAFDPTDPISLSEIDAYFYISFYDTDADDVHYGILKLEF